MKSQLAVGQRVGYPHFDVGAAVQLPPVKAALAERILDCEAVLRPRGPLAVRRRRPGLLHRSVRSSDPTAPGRRW